MLDALGARGIWERGDPKQLVVDWEVVLDQMKRRAEAESIVLPPPGAASAQIAIPRVPHAPVMVTGFSDTIIVSIDGDATEQLIRRLGRQVAAGIATGLARGILLRGAIAIGTFYRSKTIFVGPAIDQAYEWSRRADWIGAMLTPNASLLYSSFQRKDSAISIASDFFAYEVPLNNGETLKTFAVDWPSYLRTPRVYSGVRTGSAVRRVRRRRLFGTARTIGSPTWEDRKAHLHRLLAKQVIQPGTVRKYENTIRYFDYAKAQHEQWLDQIKLFVTPSAFPRREGGQV